MKYIFTIVLMLTLLFSLALSAQAAASIYVDRIWEGGESFTGTPDTNFNASFISGGGMIGPVKIGAEYGSGTLKTVYGGSDLTLYNIKVGYRLLDAKASKLDVTISNLNLQDKIGSAKFLEADGDLLGLDFTQFFSKRTFFSLTYQSAWTESFKIPPGLISLKDDSISVIRAKLGYFFSENAGVTIGFTDLVVKSNDAHIQLAFNAYTAGMVFKF